MPTPKKRTATTIGGRLTTLTADVISSEHLEEANSQPILFANYCEEAYSLSPTTTLVGGFLMHCKFLVEVSEYLDNKFPFKFKHTVSGTLILLERWNKSGVYAFNTCKTFGFNSMRFSLHFLIWNLTIN
ncbi:hypothetical protein NE237_025472 [Protea cynaroides]|uniref:Uncharacterized protein n=1 Tax=Protea cynaroides TaxID=273540 RepID=A0A9Q0H4A2_9MAGN|nr:hypothetical protein NE237_025472 [Protea cynaroides]